MAELVSSHAVFATVIDSFFFFAASSSQSLVSHLIAELARNFREALERGEEKVVRSSIFKGRGTEPGLHVGEDDPMTPHSILLFHLLGESHTFLAKEEWYLLPQYEDIRRGLRHLVPLNDSCESALALATRLNGTIARQKDSWQELVRVVAKHQELFPVFSKKDLKTFY